MHIACLRGHIPVIDVIFRYIQWSCLVYGRGGEYAMRDIYANLITNVDIDKRSCFMLCCAYNPWNIARTEWGMRMHHKKEKSVSD